MLSLMLTILKIAGIVLISVIGLAILLVCIILFVPIRYRASGYYKGDYKIRGQISWLLHFISVGIVYENNNPLKIVVRILGIPVFNNLRSGSKNKKNNVNEEPESCLHSEIKISSVDNEILNKSTEQEEIPDGSTESVSVQNDLHKGKKAGNRLISKISSFVRKIIQFIQNIKYTFLHICDIIKNIKSNINYYYNVLNQEETKLAWQACKKQLLNIWYNLKPKKYNANLHVGMEDPADMGQILGIWGMLYPLHEGRISIEPEFDHFVFEGDFNVCGRITVYIYLWAACTVLFNKNIRHFRKCLSREKKQGGK